LSLPESPDGVQRNAPDRLLIVAALAALYLIWGSTYLVMRVCIETIPPFLMGAIRFLTAGTLLYGLLRWRGVPGPTWREWRAAVPIGILLLAGGNGFIALAEQSVSSSVAALAVSTMPLWMAVFTSLAGTRPSRREWLGLFVGFAGIVILQSGGDLRASRAGAVLVLLAPISWAIGSVWSRSLPLATGAMATTTQMLAGGAAMLIIALLRGETLGHGASTRSVGALVYLIVLGSLVAFSAYGFLLRRTRPAIATSYAYVNPIVALILGASLGGEHIEKTTWLATLVILAGVLVLSTGRRPA
jgi:drug/metabolite transporter (DMT)-like permease